jgi:hypothetical protein
MLANGGACRGGDLHVAGPSDFVDAVVAAVHEHGFEPARVVSAVL